MNSNNTKYNDETFSKKLIHIRLNSLEEKIKEAKGVAQLSTITLRKMYTLERNVNNNAHIDTFLNIISYYQQYEKLSKYEKLFLNTILTEDVDNIIRIAPNIRAKYIAVSAEICDLHSQIASVGKVKGIDEYNYIIHCKKVKNDVQNFLTLCDKVITELI
jgi:hypothetical protein